MEFRSRASKFHTLSNLNSNGDLDDDALLSPTLRSSVDSGSDGRVRKRRIRGSRRRRKKERDERLLLDDPIAEEECGFNAGEGDGLKEVRCENGVDGVSEYCVSSVVCEEVSVAEGGGGRNAVVEEVAEVWSSGKLRQRNWSGSGGGMDEDGVVSSVGVYDENGKEAEDKVIDFISSTVNRKLELDENGIPRLETVESLDWKQIMAEDPSCE